MARVTVEDCIDKVDSPYELALVAKERATQLNSGLEPLLEKDSIMFFNSLQSSLFII